VADAEPEWLGQEDFIEILDDGPEWFPLAKRSGRVAHFIKKNPSARGRTLWN
jgi:hypothetical protein